MVGYLDTWCHTDQSMLEMFICLLLDLVANGLDLVLWAVILPVALALLTGGGYSPYHYLLHVSSFLSSLQRDVTYVTCRVSTPHLSKIAILMPYAMMPHWPIWKQFCNGRLSWTHDAILTNLKTVLPVNTLVWGNGILFTLINILEKWDFLLLWPKSLMAGNS